MTRFAPLALIALAACQQQAEAPKPKTETAAKAGPAKPAAATVPAAFQGEWSLDPAQCGSEGDARLVVANDRMSFYGKAAAYTATEVQPDGSLQAIARVEDSGGGYDLYNEYRLSKDKQQLTLTGAENQAPVRLTRCPAATT